MNARNDRKQGKMLLLRSLMLIASFCFCTTALATKARGAIDDSTKKQAGNTQITTIEKDLEQGLLKNSSNTSYNDIQKDSINKALERMRHVVDSIAALGWYHIAGIEGRSILPEKDYGTRVEESYAGLVLMRSYGRFGFGVRSSVNLSTEYIQYPPLGRGPGFIIPSDTSEHLESTLIQVGPSFAYSVPLYGEALTFASIGISPSFAHLQKNTTVWVRDSLAMMNVHYRTGLSLLVTLLGVYTVSSRVGFGPDLYVNFTPFRGPTVGFGFVFTYGLFDWVKD